MTEEAEVSRSQQRRRQRNGNARPLNRRIAVYAQNGQFAVKAVIDGVEVRETAKTVSEAYDIHDQFLARQKEAAALAAAAK